MEEANPIDGTSAVGADYCRCSETPATCTGVRETAGRFVEATIRLLEEPMIDNSRSGAILAREALMWINQLGKWSLPDPPECWQLPISDRPASLRDLVTVASDMAEPQSESEAWVLTYLVDGVNERLSEVPHRLLYLIDHKDTRKLDRLAAESPDSIRRGISDLIEESTPPEQGVPAPPVPTEAELLRQAAYGKLNREVARLIDAGTKRIEMMGDFQPHESDEPKDDVPVFP